ncbi:MAG TPA: hypothetical protein VLB86_15100 [Gaiellaceae bacterium]|nr:hypothetical protein [Gaiellaceae bacterium]
MTDTTGTAASRGRAFLSPGRLLAAGLLAAGFAMVLAVAEGLNPRLRDVLGWLTPARTVLLVTAVAVATAVPPVRRALAGASDRVARVSAPVALAVIVATATAFQVVRGAAKTLPVVLADELIYSDLAKSVAFDGALALRGTTHLSHSVLYPVAVSPFFRFAGDVVSALSALKTAQAFLMALAAVPAYLLARRLVSHRWSLLVAVLTALAPWTGYAALVMTEAFFYPSFVAFALALVLMLERPTPARQAVTLAVAVALALVRPQALALLPAIATAILVFAATAGSARALRPYAPALVSVGVASLAGIVALAVPSAPGGAYGALFEEAPSVTALAKWAVWNVADLELALGVVAVAAFPLSLAALLRRGASTVERAVGATAVALFVWVWVAVTLLSASKYGLGWLHERALYFVAPVLLVCLAHWLAGGLRRPAVATAVAAVAAVAVVAALPARLVTFSNEVDAPAMVPFQALLTEYPTVSARVWLVAAAVAGAAVLVLARTARAPIASVAVAFALLAGSLVWADPFDAAASRELGWVDRALPPRARATLLHVDLSVDPRERCGEAAEYEQQGLALWTEFFNTRVDRVAHVYGPIVRDGLASPELRVAAQGGILHGADGRTLARDYVVVDSRQPIAGERLARFDLGDHLPYGEGASLTLWRAERPLRLGPVAFPAPPRADGRPCP